MDEVEAQLPVYSPAVHDLVRATLRSARAELLASRELVLGGREPVGIHRSRVALRRLRAALALFRELARLGTLVLHDGTWDGRDPRRIRRVRLTRVLAA